MSDGIGWGRCGMRAVLLLTATLALASPAGAQTPAPRVWVAPLRTDGAPGAGLLSEKFDEASRKQLGDSRKVELVGSGRAVKVAAGDADPRVAQAETLRSAGKDAFAAGKTQQALEQLRAALQLYEEGIASVNRVDAIADTLVWLAAASQALEYDADARDFARRAVAIEPEVAAPERYPEAAAALLEDAREKQKKKKGGDLKVTTVPPGATVRVDGVEKGTSPVTIKDLPRGEHYVQASHGEAGIAGERVRVKGGKAETVELKLSTEVGPPAAEPPDPAHVANLVALSKAGDVGPKFRESAEAVAEKTRARYVVAGHIATRGNSFVLRPLVYGVEEKQVAALDELAFSPDLASVFVQAANFARAVEAACTRFPTDKAVFGMIVAAAPVPPPADEPPPRAAPEHRPPPAAEPAPVARRELPPMPPREPDRADEDDAFYKKWWFWTIAGAAVIGGTAYGGYVLLQDDGSSRSTYDATVRW